MQRNALGLDGLYIEFQPEVRGDIGEIQAKYRRDAGEIQARYRGDIVDGLYIEFQPEVRVRARARERH